MDFTSREDLRVLSLAFEKDSFGDFKGEGEASRSLPGEIGLYLFEGYFLRAEEWGSFYFYVGIYCYIPSVSNR